MADYTPEDDARLQGYLGANEEWQFRRALQGALIDRLQSGIYGPYAIYPQQNTNTTCYVATDNRGNIKYYPDGQPAILGCDPAVPNVPFNPGGGGRFFNK